MSEETYRPTDKDIQEEANKLLSNAFEQIKEVEGWDLKTDQGKADAVSRITDSLLALSLETLKHLKNTHEATQVILSGLAHALIWFSIQTGISLEKLTGLLTQAYPQLEQRLTDVSPANSQSPGVDKDGKTEENTAVPGPKEEGRT